MKYFIVTLSAVILGCEPVFAFPNYAIVYKAKYNYMPGCAACHDSDSWELNSYGKDFRSHGRDMDALKAIEGLDSDGNGFSNYDKIVAGANPGNPESTPKHPGYWLKDPVPVIHPPDKLLKIAFPGAKYQAREFDLDAKLVKALSSRWGAPLPDESRFSVVFPATKDGSAAGFGTYVSLDIPGRKDPGMFFVCSDPEGKLLHLKVIKYGGSSSLSKEKAWQGLLGKSPEEVLQHQGIPGPAEEVQAVEKAVARGLLVIQAAAGPAGEAASR